MTRLFTSVLFVVLSLASPALAGGTTVNPNGPVFTDQQPVDHQPVDLSGPTFVPGVTAPAATYSGDVGAAASQAVADASAFCAALPDSAYQIDCLAERLQSVAAKIPANGAYAPQKAALEKAAAQLSAVAGTYADPGKRRHTYSTAGGARPQTTTRPLRAVRPEAAAAATQAAVAIVAETQTVLLRSSRTQPDQAFQIQRIAAAVGSNKVLLRST